MKTFTLITISSALCIFLSSCSVTGSSDSGQQRTRVSATAYEIEQTNRYEFDKREQDLTLR